MRQNGFLRAENGKLSKIQNEYAKCSPIQKAAIVSLVFFLVHLLIEWPIWEHFWYNAAYLCKWDCQWYKSIVLDGYQTEPPYDDGQANFAFFPVVPLLARLLRVWAKLSPEFALILVSEYMFFLDIFVFIIFVKEIFKNVPEHIAAMILIFMPFSVHAMAGYTETTFLLFSMLTFLSFRQKNYVQSGIFGAVLTACRPVGVLIIPALALPKIFDFFKVPFKEKLSITLCFMMMPLGLFLFMYYLDFKLGDALAFVHVQVGWGSEDCVLKPFCVLIRGLTMPLHSCGFAGAVAAIASFFFCFFLYRKRQYDLAVFLFLTILSSVMIKLLSVQRYIFWNPAFLLVICYFLNKYQRYLYIVLPIMVAFMIEVYFFFLSGVTLWPI